jgi:hypothetical protein
MNRLFMLCAMVLFGLSFGNAEAAILTSSRSTIVSLIFYESFDGGDVTFTFPNNVTNVPGCVGFWIRATDGGAKTILTAILTAYQAGSTVMIDADNTQLWPGSAGHFCLVSDVRY